jgi:hypothetical protein
MKRLGALLMLMGASVGIVAAAGIGGVFHLAFPWLVNVALAKLTLVASGALMASGAVVRRIAIRREQAALPAAADEGHEKVTLRQR